MESAWAQDGTTTHLRRHDDLLLHHVGIGDHCAIRIELHDLHAQRSVMTRSTSTLLDTASRQWARVEPTGANSLLRHRMCNVRVQQPSVPRQVRRRTMALSRTRWTKLWYAFSCLASSPAILAQMREPHLSPLLASSFPTLPCEILVALSCKRSQGLVSARVGCCTRARAQRLSRAMDEGLGWKRCTAHLEGGVNETTVWITSCVWIESRGDEAHDRLLDIAHAHPPAQVQIAVQKIACA